MHTLIKDRNAGYLDSKPCAVFLNGEYWGLYLLQEKTSPCVVSELYDVPKENIFIVKHWELLGYDDEINELVSNELWDSFDVISENDMSNPDVYAHAESFMDMQSFIDYCAVQIYIANNNFNYEIVHERINEMADQYKEPVVLSEKRWRGDFSEAIFDEEYDGNYDEDEFDRNIEILDEFYKRRFAWITFYLKADLELQGELVDVDITVDDDLECSLDLNTIHFEDAPDKWSGKYFSDYPITLVCSPSGDDSEVVWFVNGVNYSEEQAIELDLNGLQEKVSIELKRGKNSFSKALCLPEIWTKTP